VTVAAHRVLVPAKTTPEMLAVLQSYPDLEIDAPGEISQAELAVRLPLAAGVIVRSNNALTADLLQAAPRLRVIGRAGTGLDNIDVEAATRRGILVMNVPAANSISTAEHTLAMLLALVRHVAEADRSVKAGRWDRGRFQGTELFGKTLGIVGLGRIGSEVASRALAFGMTVLGHDPFVAADELRDARVRLVPFDELLREADVVTLHVPLEAATRHLIGAREIGMMKTGVRILNCARGGLLDEDALCEAIEAEHVAGAALDVFESEPPGDSRVRRSERILCTPHLGGSTAEAERAVGVAIARQVGDYLSRGIVVDAVNAPR
jgi:D-3-phosphoglycerate dehydrogenase